MEFKAPGTKAQVWILFHGYDYAADDHEPPQPLKSLKRLVDERVGLKMLQAKMLNEPVPGGSRWAYVLARCCSSSSCGR